MSNRKLVARLQPPCLNALAVNSNSVGTSQISYNHLPTFLHHATMMARNSQRIESRIACGVTSHHHHGAIQHDILTVIKGHEACGHGGWSRGTKPAIHH